jgi:hypothetical protein
MVPSLWIPGATVRFITLAVKMYPH